MAAAPTNALHKNCRRSMIFLVKMVIVCDYTSRKNSAHTGMTGFVVPAASCEFYVLVIASRTGCQDTARNNTLAVG